LQLCPQPHPSFLLALLDVKLRQREKVKARKARIREEAKGSIAQSPLIYVIPAKAGIQRFELIELNFIKIAQRTQRTQRTQ
jgi:hypothetical protein